MQKNVLNLFLEVPIMWKYITKKPTRKQAPNMKDICCLTIHCFFVPILQCYYSSRIPPKVVKSFLLVFPILQMEPSSGWVAIEQRCTWHWRSTGSHLFGSNIWNSAIGILRFWGVSIKSKLLLHGIFIHTSENGGLSCVPIYIYRWL